MLDLLLDLLTAYRIARSAWAAGRRLVGPRLRVLAVEYLGAMEDDPANRPE